MVTAASTADLAIMLVDARKGVLTQTRRHSYIAATWSASRIWCSPSTRWTWSANGDMVVERGENLAWYEGQTLLELLETAPAAHSEAVEKFRFPVQYVCRPRTAEHHDFRGYMGRVESGEIAVGDAVQILPSGRTTRVRDIRLLDQSLPQAGSERSVTLLLEDEVDISRGDMIVKADEPPRSAKQIEAMVCWLAEGPLEAGRKLVVRHTTRETSPPSSRPAEYRQSTSTRSSGSRAAAWP
jgi:sulfate adenylyltransferase subunit 1